MAMEFVTEFELDTIHWAKGVRITTLDEEDLLLLYLAEESFRGEWEDGEGE